MACVYVTKNTKFVGRVVDCSNAPAMHLTDCELWILSVYLDLAVYDNKISTTFILAFCKRREVVVFWRF